MIQRYFFLHAIPSILWDHTIGHKIKSLIKTSLVTCEMSEAMTLYKYTSVLLRVFPNYIFFTCKYSMNQSLQNGEHNTTVYNCFINVRFKLIIKNIFFSNNDDSLIVDFNNKKWRRCY